MRDRDHKCSTRRCGRLVYEPTAEAAAKIVAKHLGDKGREGGWIYTAKGRPIVQGWYNYAKRLQFNGTIKTKIVVTQDGVSHERWVIVWRRLPQVHIRREKTYGKNFGFYTEEAGR